MYLEDSCWTEGIFLEESRSRFLCKVNIAGEVSECYVPSSCKLGKLVDLEGKEVLLRPVSKKNARTQFAVQAIKNDKEYILLNLADANRIIYDNMQRRFFSFIGRRKHIRNEIVVDGYKADLYVEDTDTIVEIKTLLSPSKNAVFPSVASKRAEEQLQKIERLLETHKVCYIITSLNPATKSIELNSAMGQYEELFNKCISRGMKCRGYSIVLNENKVPEVKRSIPIRV